MAVPEQTPHIEHTGNGVTTSFSLGFQCESKDHLIVLVDEIEPPIATWSLTGGNVVFTTAPAAGKKITLQRNTPFGRTTDYQSYNNSFRPPAVNKDFDWIWWKLQELGVADWILGARIDALKNYVDRKDDELKAYLMEEIRKQGVALDQLDEYYNYLMQRLAQIAVDKGWDAAFVVDASGKTQQEINNINEYIRSKQRRNLAEFGDVIQDQTTDHTALVLSALSQLQEGDCLYIPGNVKWDATSNPDAVYAAMPDNSVLIDDSGYEDRHDVKYWQASQQIYYKTKDYGGVGRANGNSHNIRGNYHPAYLVEVDSALGARGSRASTIYRFNDPTIKTSFQVGGDFTSTADQAHFSMAMYGDDLEIKFLRVGAPMSSAPSGVFWNGQVTQDVSYFYGKLKQRVDETEDAYKSKGLIVRHLMPSDHTGNFDIAYLYGINSIAYRELIDNTGRYRVITKNSKTLTTTADGEQFGAKLSVLTPTGNSTPSESLSGSYYSNVLASGGFTIKLPKAIKGTYFEFSVDAAQTLIVAPNAADSFIGMGAGKTKTSNVVGSHLRVVAISATQWSFVQSGTWIDQV